MKTRMMKFEIYRSLGLLILILFAVSSCKKDNEFDNRLTIKFKGSYGAKKSEFSANTQTNGIIIESFKINIEEIELEFDDDDPLFESGKIDDEVELKGPFEVDLMQDGTALVTTLINQLELPAAAYDEIEFEFDKNENPISEMYGKSILVKGSINGTPFVFYTDEEFEVEIEFDKKVLLQEIKESIITVSFDIAALFNPLQGGIDLTKAVDGNNNGVIEIYHDDPDGNGKLADTIADRLEDIIEAFEDRFDD